MAGWLAGIIVSLLLVGGYADMALRDLGSLLGALTLARLAAADFDGTLRRSAQAPVTDRATRCSTALPRVAVAG